MEYVRFQMKIFNMWGFRKCKSGIQRAKKKPTMPHLCGKYIFKENKWDCK